MAQTNLSHKSTKQVVLHLPRWAGFNTQWWGIRESQALELDANDTAVKRRSRYAAAKAFKELRKHGKYHNSTVIILLYWCMQ